MDDFLSIAFLILFVILPAFLKKKKKDKVIAKTTYFDNNGNVVGVTEKEDTDKNLGSISKAAFKKKFEKLDSFTSILDNDFLNIVNEKIKQEETFEPEPIEMTTEEQVFTPIVTNFSSERTNVQTSIKRNSFKRSMIKQSILMKEVLERKF
ncbi:MAG: hypothetical protein JXR48_13260 [Candidatus Delongbacteria bacterium]|nr:hypothetical protein [Candidatus Delongbacteria bacterium]MBN2835923.1 hypothetical protein [Candidatus Delongbacteria bacterium]